MTGIEKLQTPKSCDSWCHGCGHYRGAADCKICEYQLDVGHRRPCPAGKGCTEHTKFASTPKKELHTKGAKPLTVKKNGPHGKKIDDQKAMALYRAGKVDKDIAGAFGVTEAAAYSWRKKRNLPPNGMPFGQQKTKEEQNMSEPEKKEKIVESAGAEEGGCKSVETPKPATPRSPANFRLETPVKLADTPNGMSVSQLAALFEKLSQDRGHDAKVYVDGNAIREVEVMLRYRDDHDGPAEMAVGLIV